MRGERPWTATIRESRRDDAGRPASVALAPPGTGPQELPTELRVMGGRPFGVDVDGRPINHGSGKLIVGAIRYLQSYVGRRVGQQAPEGLSLAERGALVEGARAAALDRLVAMLNAAIEDDRYHVTRDYLLNDSNNYSYEFRLFVSEYCRVISGDRDFFFNQGMRSIPQSIIHLARPLGVQRTYGVLPRFTAKFVKTDLRVVRTTSSTAVIQWYGASQIERIPAQHRLPYVRYACRTYQGAYAAIPQVIAGRALATVREVRCQADGAACCEWEFAWEPDPARRAPPRLWLGAAATGLALLSARRRLPGQQGLALAGAALPVALAWHSGRAQRLDGERRRQERLAAGAARPVRGPVRPQRAGQRRPAAGERGPDAAPLGADGAARGGAGPERDSRPRGAGRPQPARRRRPPQVRPRPGAAARRGAGPAQGRAQRRRHAGDGGARRPPGAAPGLRRVAVSCALSMPDGPCCSGTSIGTPIPATAPWRRPSA